LDREWSRLIEQAKFAKYEVDVETFVETGKNEVLSILEQIDNPESIFDEKKAELDNIKVTLVSEPVGETESHPHSE
jgi:hypothetical protein